MSNNNNEAIIQNNIYYLNLINTIQSENFLLENPEIINNEINQNIMNNEINQNIMNNEILINNENINEIYNNEYINE